MFYGAVGRVGLRALNLSGVSFSPLSLFASGEQGVWFDPSDFYTYTAGSGSELVTNGNFANGSAGWTATDATASAVSGGIQVTSTGTTGRIVQNISTVVGATYRFECSYSPNAGDRAMVGVRAPNEFGTVMTGLPSATFNAGKFIGFFVATSTTAAVRLQAFDNGDVVLFYNVSVKEASGISAATMFQDAAGTTPVTAVEQPIGLALDKSKGLALGPELATAPDLSWDASAAPDTAVLAPVDAGKWYRFEWTGLSTTAAAGVTLRVGASLLDPSQSVNTSTPVSGVSYFQAPITGNFLVNAVGPNLTRVGSYASVSVREIAGNHAKQTTDASRPVLSARYNLLTYTEQFDNAAWTKSGATVSSNTTAAPDGTLTADTLNWASGTSPQVTRAAEPVLAGTPITYSVFAKAGTKSSVKLILFVDGSNYLECSFNLGTGVAGTPSATGTRFTGATGSMSLSSNGFYRCVLACETNTLTSVAAWIRGDTMVGSGDNIILWGADMRPTNDGVGIPTYQRVGAATSGSSTVVGNGDYDTNGFPCYLSCDGTDDGIETSSIDFTATDKLTFFSGVRKLNDAATSTLFETSTTFSSNPGSIQITAPGTAAPDYRFYFRGDTFSPGFAATTFTAPITNVLTCSFDIAGNTRPNEIFPRINGTVPTLTPLGSGTNQTGNFGDYKGYIGFRGSGSAYLYGRIYGLILVGRLATTSEISETETWMNSRTRAY